MVARRRSGEPAQAYVTPDGTIRVDPVVRGDKTPALRVKQYGFLVGRGYYSTPDEVRAAIGDEAYASLVPVPQETRRRDR